MKFLFKMMLGGALIASLLFSLLVALRQLPDGTVGHLAMVACFGGLAGLAFWSRMGEFDPLVEELKRLFPRDNDAQ
jgi:hypothetical protein